MTASRSQRKAKNASRRCTAAVRQRGVTLIEVLVAVVLLAVGVLGLAGLQLRGLQVNQGSQWRSMAAVMADDLADRMRAEQDSSFPGGTSTVIANFIGAFPAGAANPDPSMQDWLQVSLPQLPAGSVPTNVPPPCGGVQALPCAVISTFGLAAGTPNPVEIDIYWNDTHAATGASLAPGTPATGTLGSYHVVTVL
jgi:type IV pilus assembly protein PilV